ncbi:MAG: thiamine diphosphokinase [Firmicutes bacterium HGW-Firmicutes-1]|jgi:thiamine pyrophosphokinase|nr:MAG: thiamine diphosphokinase [Firmicutes bacterium HGW-Firmicutes-1]
MKTIIVTGGYLPLDFLKEQIKKRQVELIICADSGADALYNAGILPDVLLGDFDSVDEEVFNSFVQQGIKTVRFSAEKDLTDTHIAIKYAIKQGSKKIIILGATGLRIDHTLANIYMLEKFIRHAHLKIVDTKNSIELVSDGSSRIYHKKDYKYISLIPISRKVYGVTTEGLKYKLQDATLLRNSSFGISNEILSEQGAITIKKGLLAIVQSND